MTIDKKSAALVVLLVALAAGAVFWWQNMNRPAPESQEMPTVQNRSISVLGLTMDLPKSDWKETSREALPKGGVQVKIQTATVPYTVLAVMDVNREQSRTQPPEWADTFPTAGGGTAWDAVCAPGSCYGVVIDDSSYIISFGIEGTEPVPENLDGVWFPESTNYTQADIVAMIASIRSTAESSGLSDKPTPTPSSNTDVSVAPLSLGAAMLAVPEPELAVWGITLGTEGLFFVWTTTAPPKTDASTYVGYTVDLKAGTVIESLRRDGLGRVRFARTGEPKGLFALEWEECWEGCNRMNDYFDRATGALLYTTRWSPTIGGSATLDIVGARELVVTWDPEHGCREKVEGDVVTIKGFLIDGRSVSLSESSTIVCSMGYGGIDYSPFRSFIIEGTSLNDRHAVLDYKGIGLRIPLSPLDLSKAIATEIRY